MGLEQKPISLIPFIKGQMTLDELVELFIKRVEYLVEEELKK